MSKPLVRFHFSDHDFLVFVARNSPDGSMKSFAKEVGVKVSTLNKARGILAFSHKVQSQIVKKFPAAAELFRLKVRGVEA